MKKNIFAIICLLLVGATTAWGQATDITSVANVTINNMTNSYTGSAIYPDVTVKLTAGDTELTLHTDYEIETGAGFINVGNYPFSVKGIGSYDGQFDLIFTINPADISVGTIDITNQNAPYTGSGITPNFTVKVGGTPLTEGTDFDVDTSINFATWINAGNYTLTVNGGGNYTGTLSETFTINPATLSSVATIDISPNNVPYTGSDITPNFTVSKGGTPLSQGTDYTVIDAGPWSTVGDHTIAVQGTGNYDGTLTGTFTIAQANLSDVAYIEITNSPATYTGSAITPIVKVKKKSDNTELTLTSDYTVSGGPWTNAGTYTVTVTGAGNYKGTLTAGFIINPANINDVAYIAIAQNNMPYTGSAITPSFTVKLTAGDTPLNLTTDPTTTDYTVLSTGEGTNAGDYPIRIQGANNYTSFLEVPFTIVKKNIADCTIAPLETDYTGSVIDPLTIVKVKNVSDNDMTVGTHYTITASTGYTYKDPQTYTSAITVTGIGDNYTGTVVKNFKINNTSSAKDVATASVTSKAVYNGKQQVPDGTASTGTIEVSLNGTPLTQGTNYTLTYVEPASQYVNAGTYSSAITIAGTGTGYFGSKTVDYTIAQAPMSSVKVYNSTGTAIIPADGSVIPTLTWNDAMQDPISLFTLYLVKDDVTPANSVVLTAGTDFDYVITQPGKSTTTTKVKDEGRYTIVFTGKGNYTGTISRTFDVQKNIADETTSGVHLDIPLQLLIQKDATPSYNPFDFNISVTDTKSHATLYETEDYTLKFFDTEAKANQELLEPDGDDTNNPTPIAEADITAEGKFWVVVAGVEPKYSGKRKSAFYVMKDYQETTANSADGTYKKLVFHIDPNNPGYPVAETSPTSAVIKGEMSVGAYTNPAIDAATVRLSIPNGQTIAVGGDNINFDVKGIENNAFTGCTSLHYIDATLLADFTPSSLNRTAANTPFYGVPKQALVFLSGSVVTGENYVYNVSGNYFCDELKIYDDIQGDQKGFASTADAMFGFMNPITFTANTVTNTRKLNATSGSKQQGYTVCLPYDLPISDSFKAYKLEYSKGATTIGTENYDGVVGFTEVTDSKLTAMTPYVIIPSASGQFLNATDVEVKQSFDSTPAVMNYIAITGGTSSAVSGQQLYKLNGTMQYLSATVGWYVMQKDNVWNKIKTANDYPNQCVLPMRAYLVAGTTAPARIYSTFNSSNGTTAIENLRLDVEDNEYYDLQGRKVTNPGKGLYIKNGKKVVIK